MQRRANKRRGFALIELLAAIVLIGILIGMLLPTLGRSIRPAARQTQCQSNMKNLALATLNYESIHQHFPAAMGMPHFDLADSGSVIDRISGLVTILPQMEQQAMYDLIAEPTQIDGVDYPAFGVAPWNAKFPAWQTQIPLLSCPSASQVEGDFGTTNYAFCIGDAARNIHSPTEPRGVFACGMTTKTEQVTDGMSNTILFAEIGASGDNTETRGGYAKNQPATLLKNPSECLKLVEPKKIKYLTSTQLAPLRRGGCWGDGAGGVSLVNTILPPNSPSAAVGGEIAVDGFYSSASFHPGGVQVAFADGHVQSIDEDIDAGDPSSSTLTPAQMAQPRTASPHGVWGALGSAAGAEVASADNW